MYAEIRRKGRVGDYVPRARLAVSMREEGQWSSALQPSIREVVGNANDHRDYLRTHYGITLNLTTGLMPLKRAKKRTYENEESPQLFYSM